MGSSQTFEEIVAKDVKNNASNAEIEILSSNTKHWLSELNSLKRDVEIQLAAQKARITLRQADNMPRSEWLKYKASEEHWRLGVLRFMASIEQKMLYVKRLRADGD